MALISVQNSVWRYEKWSNKLGHDTEDGVQNTEYRGGNSNPLGNQWWPMLDRLVRVTEAGARRLGNAWVGDQNPTNSPSSRELSYWYRAWRQNEHKFNVITSYPPHPVRIRICDCFSLMFFPNKLHSKPVCICMFVLQLATVPQLPVRPIQTPNPPPKTVPSLLR